MAYRESSGYEVPVTEDGIKTNKERLASSRKNNREQLNGYWRGYYARKKEQIKQRLRKQRQRQRQIGQNIMRFEVLDQGSEKLETSLVRSEHAVTLYEMPHKFLH